MIGWSWAAANPDWKSLQKNWLVHNSPKVSRSSCKVESAQHLCVRAGVLQLESLLRICWKRAPKLVSFLLSIPGVFNLGGKFGIQNYCCERDCERASRAPLCFYSRAESGWNSFLPAYSTMGGCWSTYSLAANIIIRFPLIQFIRVSESFEKIPIFDFPPSWYHSTPFYSLSHKEEDALMDLID